jgi:hypothetical protein
MISMYQGKDIIIKQSKPQRKCRQKKYFISFLINRKTATAEKGKIIPRGPLVKTANAEKIKNNITPVPFFAEYPQKKDSIESKIKVEKTISVNMSLDKPI